MYLKYDWPTVKFVARQLNSSDEIRELADRQDRVTGFDTAQLQRKRVLCVGAGGLGCPVVWGLAKKGVGWLHVMDDDYVEVSNLTRQYFTIGDLYRPKAFRLASHAAESGALGTLCLGHKVRFDEEIATEFQDVDAAIVLVDNNQTRRAAALFGRKYRIPIIFAALDESAEFCWTFAQSPTGPCLACVFPRVADPSTQKQPCRAVPSIVDSCFLAASLVLRALDCVLLGRDQWWNFRSIHLAGGPPDVIDTVEIRRNCSLCGSAS